MSLPKGWIETNLQTIGKIVTGKTPCKKNMDFYGGDCLLVKPGDLDKDILVTHTEDRLTELGLENAPAIPEGSVMVTCIGNMGKVGIASQKLATNQQINSIVPNIELIDSRYLYYFSKTLKSWLDKESSATTISIINKSKFSIAPILLPPLNEQKCIAQKLDEVLSTVESIKTRLDNAPTILKRFRQSILAAATSGKLTEEWRRENGIAEEWEDKKLEEVCKSISDGDHQAPPKASEGIPFLVISNIRSGDIDFETVTRWVPLEYYDSLKDIRKAQRNDILYTVTGSYGIPVIVNTDKQFCFQRHIAIIKSDEEEIETKYLFLLLSSHQIMEQAHSVATGTAQKTVPLRGLRNFTMFLPSKDEQKEIVSQVESLFALADSMEAKIEAAQKHVDKLTQSILAKAFRGELVPQDPNDEPAEKLLERIRVEQESVKSKKSRGKKSK